MAICLTLANSTRSATITADLTAQAAANTSAAASAAPKSPQKVCENSRLLRGPAHAPHGATVVRAGNNAAWAAYKLPANRTYWFAPGTHTIGSSQYAQIDPGHNDKFIGAPGAVLDGQGKNASAFDGTVTGVTIEYLKIQNFNPAGSQGAVNHDSARGWLITHDTIDHNSPGAGVMMGTRDTVTYDCLTKNGEYGFSAYVPPSSREASALTHGPLDLTLSHDEISYNDTCNFEQTSPNPVPRRLVPNNCGGGGEGNGCGCSGAGKFWQVDNAVVAGNYIHNNYSVGLWADTDNNGFIFRGNYIARNYAPGILYEISYNTRIKNNTFIDNAIGEGPTNGGFPTGAIYLSESGGDGRVPNSARIKTISITGNTFTNNWSGVVLWESADRFCGSPDNSSTGVCTLVEPKVANIKTCVQANLGHAKPSMRPDYYDLCRWKTQNVTVSDNAFHMTDSAVARCRAAANSCGENAIFSQYGTSPSWSPYHGNAIPLAITRAQHNRFTHNTYTGRWEYMYFNQSTVLSLRQWRKRGQD